MTVRKIGALIALFILSVAGIFVLRDVHRHIHIQAAAASMDETPLKAFYGQQPATWSDFEALALYFEDGFVEYKDAAGSTAEYPGLSSIHGTHRDSVEGFSRMAPIMAVLYRAEASSPRGQLSKTLLMEGLSSGSDPESQGYWGRIRDNDQLIVEAADIALAVWLVRDSIWTELPERVRTNVVQWLLQVNHKQVPDNNWHLFIPFVNLTVSSLGYPSDMEEAHKHYARFREFYRGDGWFSDGPGSRFDFYNAWGIQYQLFWIDQVDPKFDHQFIETALNQFAQSLVRMIGPNGIPILGRSICYRIAISAPLLLDQKLANPSVSPGEARRALDVTWKYFIQHGAVSHGTITQGYCGADSRLLDNYSGPASCLWSLRSLIGALYVGRSEPLWRKSEEPLPVEESNYSFRLSPLQWTIRATRPSTIVIETEAARKTAQLNSEQAIFATLDRWIGSAHRPENEVAKYGLADYRSDAPFCGCQPAR